MASIGVLMEVSAPYYSGKVKVKCPSYDVIFKIPGVRNARLGDFTWKPQMMMTGNERTEQHPR